MISASVPRPILVRIDAQYEPTVGFRDLATIVARIRALIQTLPAGTPLVLIGNRGRPVVAPRDSFARIRSNNPILQFQELAAALAREGGNSFTEPTLVAVPTVQIPAYRVTPTLCLLENLAFDPREAANDQVLARQLAAIGQQYIIDDARALNDRSASIASVPKAIPTSVSGLVAHDLALIDRLALSPNHPFVAVVGGNQVARKLRVIRRLADVADELLVGGVVANTFLVARGVDLRRSPVDGADVDTAKQLDAIVGSKLILPTDFVWRAGRVMDIGPNSRARFARSIADAATILLAGPVGVTSPQLEAFHFGTLAVTEAIATSGAATKLALGDDAQAIADPAVLTTINGDAAALDYLAGGKLVALEAIQRSRYTTMASQ